ncbi:izumo sperm-egg fusion protein 2 isoform X4 [Monodelphis domestica]|uniref:izumo sperm-egg fusion protein 2 isoform X4 n=1 Tax=Monodelphis domestica TaxID=13616 RepID=UPI0024E26E9F|nr:izumo sperm-egg fusion protein 2 isoform X4 [Monodelphis domestica]
MGFLLLQLLMGLSLGLVPGAEACLQCEASIRQGLARARERLMAQNFRNERLQARAQALLLGMEREFFVNYATQAYMGRVGLGQFSPVVALAQQKIQEIQETYLTDRLSSQVLDCLRCQRVYAKCLNPKLCFGDRQPRLALRYGAQGVLVRDGNKNARLVVVCLGVITFGVLAATAYTYRNNRRLLRGYRRLNEGAYE